MSLHRFDQQIQLCVSSTIVTVHSNDNLESHIVSPQSSMSRTDRYWSHGNTPGPCIQAERGTCAPSSPSDDVYVSDNASPSHPNDSVHSTVNPTGKAITVISHLILTQKPSFYAQLSYLKITITTPKERPKYSCATSVYK